MRSRCVIYTQGNNNKHNAYTSLQYGISKSNAKIIEVLKTFIHMVSVYTLCVCVSIYDDE